MSVNRLDRTDSSNISNVGIVFDMSVVVLVRMFKRTSRSANCSSTGSEHSLELPSLLMNIKNAGVLYDPIRRFRINRMVALPRIHRVSDS
jgi:hypothetical protein